MTDNESLELRALIEAALKQALGRRLPFVLVVEVGADLDIMTNVKHTALLPKVLEQAAEATRGPGHRPKAT